MEKDEKKKGAMLDEAFLQNLMQNEQVEQILEEGEAFQTLMAYYRCAIMEVETKFKVLNTEFSLRYDRNPIETIKTRLKSPESIIEKLHRKKIPFSAEMIEENPILLHNEKRMMKAEVQFRTIAMDFWASLEHRIYYKKGQNNETLRNELRQCAEVSAALDLRMQSIRKELDVDD